LLTYFLLIPLARIDNNHTDITLIRYRYFKKNQNTGVMSKKRLFYCIWQLSDN